MHSQISYESFSARIYILFKIVRGRVVGSKIHGPSLVPVRWGPHFVKVMFQPRMAVAGLSTSHLILLTLTDPFPVAVVAPTILRQGPTTLRVIAIPR